MSLPPPYMEEAKLREVVSQPEIMICLIKDSLVRNVHLSKLH